MKCCLADLWRRGGSGRAVLLCPTVTPHTPRPAQGRLEMKARATTAQTSFNYSKLYLHLLSCSDSSQAPSKPSRTPAPSPCPAMPRPPRLSSVLLGQAGQQPPPWPVCAAWLGTLPCHNHFPSPSSYDKLAVAKSFAISPHPENSPVLRSARLMH